MYHYSKTDIRHWEGKVAFQSAKSKTYSVQIQHDNRRSWIGLGTANKEHAALLARNLYKTLSRTDGKQLLPSAEELPPKRRST